MLLPIFLSEVNGQQPSLPPSLPRSLSLSHPSLSVWLNCAYMSPCRVALVPTPAPQSSSHAADGARRLQTVTLCSPWKWVIWGKGVCAPVSEIETHTRAEKKRWGHRVFVHNVEINLAADTHSKHRGIHTQREHISWRSAAGMDSSSQWLKH